MYGFPIITVQINSRHVEQIQQVNRASKIVTETAAKIADLYCPIINTIGYIEIAVQ